MSRSIQINNGFLKPNIEMSVSAFISIIYVEENHEMGKESCTSIFYLRMSKENKQE